MLMVLEEACGERCRVFKPAVVRAASVPFVLAVCAICTGNLLCRGESCESCPCQSLGAVSCVMGSGLAAGH